VLVYNNSLTRVRASLPCDDCQGITYTKGASDPFRQWSDATGVVVLPSLQDWRDAEKEAQIGLSQALNLLRKMQP
jgi:hypothetical protein